MKTHEIFLIFIFGFNLFKLKRQENGGFTPLSEKSKLLQQNYAQQIADCAEMRQAILREAFEGRL